MRRNESQRRYYEANRDDINRRRRAADRERYRNDPVFREREKARLRRARAERKLLREWGIE